MKKGKKKLVTVKWLDHAATSEWQTIEEIKKWVEETKKHPCVSKGYVVYEDKDVLVLSAEDDGGENFGNCSLIFKKLIVKK